LADLASILGPVEGLESAVVLGPCVLGHPASGDPGPLVLGEGVVIRAYSVLYQGSRVGAGTQIGHGTLIREGNDIGAGSSVGSGARLEPGNRVGDRTRIHSGCFLASVTLGDDVFCGPGVTFTDDRHPPCPNYPECCAGVVVEDGAALGARAVLLPGITVGAGALVGAGAVVTRSVEPGVVVAGNPAKVVGRRQDLTCPAEAGQQPD
jgi:acetyltransferase-like isoleucine patch superfamily enzyme